MLQPEIYRFGPLVKHLLAKFKQDISSLKSMGPHGTILKGNVLATIKPGVGSGKSLETPKLHKPSEPPKNEKTILEPTAHVYLQSPC